MQPGLAGQPGRSWPLTALSLISLVVLAGLVSWQARGWLLNRQAPSTPEPEQAVAEKPDNPEIFAPEAVVVPPLDAKLLTYVKDSTALPMLDEKVRDAKQRQELERQEFEYEAYCDALKKAYEYPAHAFATNSRRDLTYAHLFHEPRKYRGEMVHLEGRLKRVRRFDPPQLAAQAGVRDLYEGWLFSPQYGANPFCVVFTSLPEGLEVAEQMEVPATFDGYFFKKYRYKAADNYKPTQFREVPLLIAHAPVLKRVPVQAASGPVAWYSPMAMGFVIVLGASIVLAIGLAVWYQRGDRNVRAQLADTYARRFLAEAEDGIPPPAPEIVQDQENSPLKP